MEIHDSSDGGISKLGQFTALGVSIAALYAGSRLLANRNRHSPIELNGKVVLITGGSRGLGLAMAKEFGHQGSSVAICARDTEELAHAKDLLSAEGITAESFTCDVTNRKDIESLIENVIQRFGRIDILVNNAGLIKVAPLESQEVSDFEAAMNLMFWAPFHVTTNALPHMKKLDGATIINIASVGGRVSVPHLTPYSCAKFALVGFSEGLAAELQNRNINVLTVCPGLMRTGSYLNAEFKGKVEQEFGWFSLLGNLPGFSVPAAYAARQICNAAKANKHYLTISLPAKILIGSNAVLPELTQTLLGVMSSVLPSAGSTSSVLGKNVNPKFGKWFQVLTTLGRQAAHRLNQAPAA